MATVPLSHKSEQCQPASQNTDQPFRLFDLPVEIRSIIFSLLLVKDEWIYNWEYWDVVPGPESLCKHVCPRLFLT